MSCQCREAVLRAYRELRVSGQRGDRAYEAAVHVFRHYHPDRPRVEAFEVVADWLDRHELGDEPGEHPLEAEPNR